MPPNGESGLGSTMPTKVRVVPCLIRHLASGCVQRVRATPVVQRSGSCPTTERLQSFPETNPAWSQNCCSRKRSWNSRESRWPHQDRTRRAQGRLQDCPGTVPDRSWAGAGNPWAALGPPKGPTTPGLLEDHAWTGGRPCQDSSRKRQDLLQGPRGSMIPGSPRTVQERSSSGRRAVLELPLARPRAVPDQWSRAVGIDRAVVELPWSLSEVLILVRSGSRTGASSGAYRTIPERTGSNNVSYVGL